MADVSINGLGWFKDARNKNALVFLGSDGGHWMENPTPGEPVGSVITTENGPSAVIGMGDILELFASSEPIPAGLFMDQTAAYGRLFMCFSENKLSDNGIGLRQVYWNTDLSKYRYAGLGTTENGGQHGNPSYASSGSAGDIRDGIRYAIVLFQTETGYITGYRSQAIVPIQVVATDEALSVSDIPIHPESNVTKRIIAFTQSGASSDGPYFYIPEDDFIEGLNFPVDGNNNNITSTVINDNATVAATFNFPDEYLLGGVDVTLFIDKGIPARATSIYYSKTLRRLILCGEDIDTFRLSEPDDPETFYLSTGLAQPGQGDGGHTVTAREFRSELYFLKDNGGYLAVDTSLTPAEWSIRQRWEGSGPCGPWAIDTCDEFMAFASREGPFIYRGEGPEWIGYEVAGLIKNDPVWEKINWEHEEKIYVLIDDDNQIVKFGVPYGDSTKVNMELIVDYSEGWKRKRWSYDDVAATRVIKAERILRGVNPTDKRLKVQQILHGSNADDGLILYEDPENRTLNGAPINQKARIAYTPSMKVPGIYQLNSADVVIEGTGNANVKIYGPEDNLRVLSLDIPLSGIAGDFSRKVAGYQNERWSVEITNKAELQNWFTLHRVMLWLNKIWENRSR
jgi:hypothetical protein